MYLATIETLALAVDAKDQVTHGHIRRVQSFAVALTRRLAGADRGLLHAMEAASLLHDMGKLAVPEHILNKPGKLTSAEFDRMKLHASIGADILSSIHFPYPVIPIVRHHHENWDGTGYPDGLAGIAIPLGARILSVIDCFDALTSDRPYRPRLTTEQALGILVQRRGVMYDPLIVDTLVQHISEGTTHGEIEPGHGNSALLELARRIAQNARFVPSGRSTMNSVHCSARFLRACATLGAAPEAPSLHDAMQTAWPYIADLVQAALAILYVYDPSTDDLAVAYVNGPHDHSLSQLRVPLGKQLAGWVGATRRSALNSNPTLDFDKTTFPICGRMQSCLMVPLVIDEMLVGTLGLYSLQPSMYTADDQHVVELLSGHVANLVIKVAAADGETNSPVSVVRRVASS